jgi:hypothetical protein
VLNTSLCIQIDFPVYFQSNEISWKLSKNAHLAGAITNTWNLRIPLNMHPHNPQERFQLSHWEGHLCDATRSPETIILMDQ